MVYLNDKEQDKRRFTLYIPAKGCTRVGKGNTQRAHDHKKVGNPWYMCIKLLQRKLTPVNGLGGSWSWYILEKDGVFIRRDAVRRVLDSTGSWYAQYEITCHHRCQELHNSGRGHLIQFLQKLGGYSNLSVQGVEGQMIWHFPELRIFLPLSEFAHVSDDGLTFWRMLVWLHGPWLFVSYFSFIHEVFILRFQLYTVLFCQLRDRKFAKTDSFSNIFNSCRFIYVLLLCDYSIRNTCVV